MERRLAATNDKETAMQEKTPPAWGTPPKTASEQPEAAPADSAYTQWYEVKKGEWKAEYRKGKAKAKLSVKDKKGRVEVRLKEGD